MSRQDYLNRTFSYNISVGSGLTWKEDRLFGNGNNCVNAYKGDMCGSINLDGYYMVWDNSIKASISCHRIIYEMHKGDIPYKMQIDHMDGNRTNNAIENLRCIKSKINARNQALRKDNATGIKGASFNIRKDGYVTAVAYWSDLNGKKCGKYFSVNKYGIMEAFKMATVYRKQMMTTLQELGADYSERHLQTIKGECYEE